MANKNVMQIFKKKKDRLLNYVFFDIDKEFHIQRFQLNSNNNINI